MKATFFLLFLLLTAFDCNQEKQSIPSAEPYAYTTFQNVLLNLYKWEGTKTVILSGSNSLDPIIMEKWLAAMDGTYDYYFSCTNKAPTCAANTCINGKTTIARVANTCGAGCGYLGFNGIELQNTYFDTFYNALANNDKYSQEPFYEFGRNFWFYDSKLKYQANDPVVTGYAVFMRFMAMDKLGLQGANFGTLTFPQFQTNVKNLLTTYLANPDLNWSTTLGVGQGVPGSQLGATDLFASFCFYLKEHYGGHAWVQNVWKYASLRPNASSTQDAVDNFIIASSQAANTNLVTLFQQWKWTPSPSAVAFLNATFSNSVKLSSATITFLTHKGNDSDDKDNNTSVNVTLANSKGATAASLGCCGNQTFPDTDSTNGPFDLQLGSVENILKEDIGSGLITIGISPDGDDTWHFSFIIKLTFSDGTTKQLGWTTPMTLSDTHLSQSIPF